MSSFLDEYVTGLTGATTAAPNTDYVYVVTAGGEKKMPVRILRGTPLGGTVGGGGDLDLAGKGGSDVLLSGSTTDITSFAVGETEEVTVTFDDARTIVYDATNLPIPGNANIQTAVGDKAIIVGGPSDVGYIKQYIPKAVQYIPRVTKITSAASITPDADTTDEYYVTALDETACVVHVPTGTPRDGQELNFRITAADDTPITFPSHAVVGFTFPASIEAGFTWFVYTHFDKDLNAWFITRVSLEEDPFYRQAELLAAFVSSQRSISAKTADYTVLAADHAKIFNNVGAAGDVIFTLPATGGCTTGKTKFTFRLLDGAGRVAVEVDGSDHLLGYSAASTSAFDITGGASIQAITVGSMMTVSYQGGTTWAVDAISGDWA